MVNVLNDMIQQAEQGANALQRICGAARTELQSHLEHEIPDVVVAMLVEYFSIFDGILTLFEPDIFKMYGARLAVSDLKVKMKSRDGDAESLVANALAS
eukprot:2102286-Amphidinium_carterae.1